LEACLADLDRGGGPQAPRHGRRPQGEPAAPRPHREPQFERRHRPLRQLARFRARCPVPVRERDRQPADPTHQERLLAGRHIHRLRRRVLQQAHRDAGHHAGEPCGRAVAERLVLLPDGLVEVAYQLRRVSHQLKVFVAIRKEAFAKFDETTSMAQQYRGSTVDIVYLPTSLREIFVNNIRRETPRNLVDPGRLKSDPLAAFFGTDVATHDFTGESEDLFEYVCRHTLRRPRDFMTVGRKLSQLSPEERRREPALKNAVHDAATAIAREYINEIHPYLGGIDLYAPFPLIDRNVLTRAECEAIFLEYAIATGRSHEPPHVFSALFRAGLLGWVDVDLATGRMVQKFLLPGERAFEHGDALPLSSHYLLHPVLTLLIGEANPRYVRNRDHTNEIGSGRPWIEQSGDELLCAVRADILHFSAFLGDAA